MASVPSPPIVAPSTCAPGNDQGAFAERALFTLSTPIKARINGIETDTREIRMRALDTADLPFLDQFYGKPMGMAVNVVALLCDLTVDQVRIIPIDDFINPAVDAIWQVEQMCERMGLPNKLLTQPCLREDEGDDYAG